MGSLLVVYRSCTVWLEIKGKERKHQQGTSKSAITSGFICVTSTQPFGRVKERKKSYIDVCLGIDVVIPYMIL